MSPKPEPQGTAAGQASPPGGFTPLSGATGGSSQSSGSAATDFSKSRTVTPPPRHDRLVDLITVALCLLLSAPLMLIDLRRPDVVDGSEATATAVSVETWNRQTDTPLEHIEPYLNGRPKFDRGPGITWLHQGVFALTAWRSGTMDLSALIWRARLVSVVLALMSIAAVYWVGRSIGGVRTARFAALICAANPVLIYYARLAAPAMAQMALTLLAIAAALWAIRPLKPAPSLWRQGIGWIIAGLMCGAAILTAGPMVLLTFGLPVLMVVALCPNRMSHILGLLAALGIGVLLATPWALYAHDHVANVGGLWWAHMLSRKLLASGPAALAELELERLGIVLAILLPWSLWLLGALGQPFSGSSEGLRLRMLLGWSWFVVTTILLLLRPVQIVLGDFLLLVPAGSVLLGQLFDRYCDLAAQGRYPRFWTRVRWPHLALLLAGSVLAPLLLHDPQMLVRLGWFDPGSPGWAAVSWPTALGLMVVLAGILLLSARWVYRHSPGKALAAWALWMWALLLVAVVPVARGPLFANSLKQEGWRLATMTGTHPVYLVEPQSAPSPSGDQARAPEPDPRLLLYSGRGIPPVTLPQLGGAQAANASVFLLVPQQFDQAAMDTMIGTGHGDLLRQANFPSAGMNLWILTTTAVGPLPSETENHVQ